MPRLHTTTHTSTLLVTLTPDTTQCHQLFLLVLKFAHHLAHVLVLAADVRAEEDPLRQEPSIVVVIVKYEY